MSIFTENQITGVLPGNGSKTLDIQITDLIIYKLLLDFLIPSTVKEKNLDQIEKIGSYFVLLFYIDPNRENLELYLTSIGARIFFTCIK